MKKLFIKRLANCFAIIISIFLGYVLFAISTSSFAVNRNAAHSDQHKQIYLSTNGIHLDIVMPLEVLSQSLLSDLKYENHENYFSFGWGDENFYLNVPTWEDLTFGVALKAMFLKSSSLIHLTKYEFKQSNWISIAIDEHQLDKLIDYIEDSFQKDKNGRKILLVDKGYRSNDDFYKAIGSYSCFKTCNTWVNTGFKKSNLKSCLWTPFDFSLMNKYK